MLMNEITMKNREIEAMQMQIYMNMTDDELKDNVGLLRTYSVRKK